MNKRTFLKNTALIGRIMSVKALAVFLVLLISYCSYGQKTIDLSDCKTVNRIMNDTVIKKFLNSGIGMTGKDGFVFEDLPGTMSLHIGCKSFDINGKNCKIFDSSEVAALGYIPIEISAFETKKKSILLALEWMEIGAKFEVTRDNRGYKVRLFSIDHLD